MRNLKSIGAFGPKISFDSIKATTKFASRPPAIKIRANLGCVGSRDIFCPNSVILPLSFIAPKFLSNSWAV